MCGFDFVETNVPTNRLLRSRRHLKSLPTTLGRETRRKTHFMCSDFDWPAILGNTLVLVFFSWP
jgi:hypothetical protein